MTNLILTVFVLCLSFQAQADSKKIKIGFVLSTLQEERYQKDQKYFTEESNRLGAEAVVVSADNNEQTQTTKVENLLSSGVKALVIQAVNSDAAASMVKAAHDDKVPVIAYDRLINNAPVDFFITVDAFEIGRVQAEAAVKHTGGKGKYVILMGQAGQSASQQITDGVRSVLDKHPAIKVVVQQTHDAWSPQLAMATVENALTQHKNKIDAILANNSGMAQGAVRALKEQKLTGKVFVAGSDADLANIKYIVSGEQQLEVLKEIAPFAKAAARIAVQLARGEKPESNLTVASGKYSVPALQMPVYPVTRENLDERVFSSGFHTKKAVYGK
jgi:D-xylose transport system substrate-binding protein